MPSEREFIQTIQSHATQLAQAVTEAEYWHDRVMEEAQQTYERRLQEIRAQHEQTLAEARRAHQRSMTEAERELQEVEQAGGRGVGGGQKSGSVLRVGRRCGQ